MPPPSKLRCCVYIWLTIIHSDPDVKEVRDGGQIPNEDQMRQLSLKTLVETLHLGTTRPHGVEIKVDHNIVMWIASWHMSDDLFRHGLPHTNNGEGRLLTPLRLCRPVLSEDTTAAARLFNIVGIHLALNSKSTSSMP